MFINRIEERYELCTHTYMYGQYAYNYVCEDANWTFVISLLCNICKYLICDKYLTSKSSCFFHIHLFIFNKLNLLTNTTI